MSTPFDQLTNIFAKLPGLGPRSARRLTLHLLKNKQRILEPLLATIIDVKEKLKTCSTCFALDVTDPCSICANKARDRHVLCIVAEVLDVWAIERCQIFNGYYHVLGGILSAVEGIGPDDLHFEELVARVKTNQIEEIVLALSPTVDGQTTVHYIKNLLKNVPVRITTLAQGIPLGGELDYIDDGTISMAFRYRMNY